jgi:hypothetical protein
LGGAEGGGVEGAWPDHGCGEAVGGGFGLGEAGLETDGDEAMGVGEDDGGAAVVREGEGGGGVAEGVGDGGGEFGFVLGFEEEGQGQKDRAAGEGEGVGGVGEDEFDGGAGLETAKQVGGVLGERGVGDGLSLASDFGGHPLARR